MFKKFGLMLVFCLVLIAIAGCGPPNTGNQDPTYTLQFSLCDWANPTNPLAQVNANIVGTSSSATSDQNGKVTIPGAPVGNYFVQLSKNGLLTMYLWVPDTNIINAHAPTTGMGTQNQWYNNWTNAATDQHPTYTYTLVHGQITDSKTFGPVANIKVLITPNLNGETVNYILFNTYNYNTGLTKTDGSGQYIITGLQTNTTYSISFQDNNGNSIGSPVTFTTASSYILYEIPFLL